MQLKAWTFSKKHNSTAQPTGAATTYNVVLKEDCSVDNPVFILGTGIVSTINYCQALGHYYFIDSIVILTKDQVELHCSMDVLATYKTEIGNYTAFVERAASSYNAMLTDSALSETQQVQYEATQNTVMFTQVSSDGVYVMGVVGGYGSGTGGISVYVMTASELADALDFIFDDGSYTDIFDDAVVKSFFNPFQYIVFLRWYPLTKAEFGTLANVPIKFGWWNTGAHTFDKLTAIRIFTAEYLSIPAFGFADFRNYDGRFTQMTVEIPTVGTVQIDPSVLSAAGSKLMLAMNIDIVTGESVVYIDVYNSANTKVGHVASYTGNMGASIPVGQVNSNLGSILKSGAEIAAGVVGGMVNVAAGGVAGIAANLSPTPSMIGTYGSRAYYEGMTIARVSLRQYGCGEFATSVYGRPLCQNKVINTLSGFIKCNAASISLAAPLSEINEVNNYLNTGFYYE